MLHKKMCFLIISLVCGTINLNAMQFTTDPSESKESRLEHLMLHLTALQTVKKQKQARIDEKKSELQSDNLATYIRNYFTFVYGPRIFKSEPGTIFIPGTGIIELVEIGFKTAAYLLLPISAPVTTAYAIKHWWQERILKGKQKYIDNELSDLAGIEETIKKVSKEIKSVKNLPEKNNDK